MVPLRIVTDADIETGRFGPDRAGIPPLAEPGPAERNRLDGLRIVKRLLRLSSRRDPFIAFAVYTTSSPAAQEAAELGDEPYGILMHALDLVLRRPPEIWGPGDSEITFDEAWLLGLFLAVECVTRRETNAPDAALAGFVVNHLRQNGVLISATGPGANILKIRPPLVLQQPEAEILLDAVETAFAAAVP